MERRKRGRPAGPTSVTVPSTTASTPQRARQSRRGAANENESANVSSQRQPARSSRASYGPPTRRNAPRTGSVAPSIASIPTRGEDQSDYDENEESPEESPEPSLVGDEVQVEQPGDPEGDDEVESGEGSDDSAALNYIKEIMERTIPELDHCAEGLIDHLKQPEPDIAVWKGILSYKREAFKNVRSLYHAVGNCAPFLSVDLLNHIGESGRTQTEVAVLHANIATALSGLHAAADETADNVKFWDRLDQVFVEAFVHHSSFEGAQFTLEIRTQRAIAHMQAGGKAAKPHDIIAECFCEGDGTKSAVDLISSGPFRSIGLLREDDHIEACQSWLRDTLTMLKPKKDALVNLKRTYSLDKIRPSLRKWLLAQAEESRQDPSPLKKTAPSEPAAQHARDVDLDAGAGGRPEIDDEMDGSALESQEIIRAVRSQNNPTLFSGPGSLDMLNRSERSKAPPSNQQGSMHEQDIPADYPEESESAILRNVPRSSFHQRSSGGITREQIQVPDEDEDDDDIFEEDTRPANHGKRRAPDTTAASASKRVRTQPPSSRALEAGPARRSYLSNPVSSSGPVAQPRSTSGHMAVQRSPTARSYVAPSASAPALSMPPPSSADFQAIAERKRMMVSSQRAAQPPASQQRKPWTEHDCRLLIDLICNYQSKWATIQKQGNLNEWDMEGARRGEPPPTRELFDDERNQQACRDKARNMKVDFLLTDAILPPGFDTVVLGPKEVRKVENMGKNPTRREADVINDKAVNTEFM